MDYILSLDNTSRARYLEKIKVINNKCPYTIEKSIFKSIKKECDSVSSWPELTYPDFVNYLIHTTSAFTLNELKAYKSLESYNYFISGFVMDILYLIENDHSLFMGSVLSIHKGCERAPFFLMENELTKR